MKNRWNQPEMVDVGQAEPVVLPNKEQLSPEAREAQLVAWAADYNASPGRTVTLERYINDLLRNDRFAPLTQDEIAGL